MKWVEMTWAEVLGGILWALTCWALIVGIWYVIEG